MELSEQQRSQLDGIVAKMQQNKETDSYIQHVVNDFKLKNAAPPAPVASSTFGGKALDIAKNVLSFPSKFGEKAIVQPAIGFAKKAASEAINLGQMGGGILNAGLKSVGVKNVMPTSSPLLEKAKTALAPTNLSQKAGGVGLDVAEFAGMPEAKGGLLAKSVLGGITGTLAGAAQTGDTKQSAIFGAINAALPGAGSAIGAASAPVKEWLATKVAPGLIDSMIKPATKLFSFGKDPGKAIVDEKIVGNTFEDLGNKVISKMDSIGKNMDKVLSSPEIVSKGSQDVTPLITEPIDNAMKDAISNGEQALYTRLLDIKNGLTKEFSEVEGKLVPTKDKLLSLNAQGIKDLKTQVGKGMKWTGQAFDNEANKVRYEIYSNLRKAEEALAPGMKELNARWGNLLGAQKAIESAALRDIKKSPIGMKEMAGGMAAATTVLPELLSGNIEKAAATLASELAIYAGAKATESPAVVTRIAKTLGNLTEEEKTALSKAFPIFKGILMQLNAKAKPPTP